MTPNDYFAGQSEAGELGAATFSDVALNMASSRILVIAYAVRAQIEAGATVANFTVGDFKPSQFQIPSEMKQYIQDA